MFELGDKYMNTIIGRINRNVIHTLCLNIKEETPIFIGKANIDHMKSRHPKDYEKYGHHISNIIENPTYLARDERKNSIEFIKKYILNNELVLVVVKASRK